MAQGVIFHFDSHIAQRKYCNIKHDVVALKKDVYELVNYLKSMNVPICPVTSSLQKRVSNILDLMSYFGAFVLKDSEVVYPDFIYAVKYYRIGEINYG